MDFFTLEMTILDCINSKDYNGDSVSFYEKLRKLRYLSNPPSIFFSAVSAHGESEKERGVNSSEVAKRIDQMFHDIKILKPFTFIFKDSFSMKGDEIIYALNQLETMI